MPSDPQLENGWLKIANELAEAFASAKLTTNEWQIIWCVIRMTYGYKRKSAVVSSGVIQQMTGISRQNIYKTVNKLEAKNILKIDRQGYKKTTYQLQKYPSKWSKRCSTGGLQDVVPVDYIDVVPVDYIPITLYLKKKERKNKERKNSQSEHPLVLPNVKNKNNSDDIFSEKRKKSSQEKRKPKPDTLGELLHGVIQDKN